MPLRPQPKRRDDIFFLCMVAAILSVNFVGFAKTYYLAGVFRAPLPGPLVHIHGALFTSWLLLLAVQTALVAVNRIRLHRTFGVLGGIIASGMLLFGSMVTASALRRHAFPTEGRAAFILVADVGALILFALFVTIGLLKRNDVVQHKRLMLLASIAILGPALSRWSFPFMKWPPAVFLLWLMFPLSLLVFDTVSRRRPCTVTVVGCILLLMYVCSVGPLSSTRAVRTVVRSAGSR
ncbi:MAG: hypothetical protein ACRYGF_06435 [Janthinobacterium lividum]